MAKDSISILDRNKLDKILKLLQEFYHFVEMLNRYMSNNLVELSGLMNSSNRIDSIQDVKAAVSDFLDPAFRMVEEILFMMPHLKNTDSSDDGVTSRAILIRKVLALSIKEWFILNNLVCAENNRLSRIFLNLKKSNNIDVSGLKNTLIFLDNSIKSNIYVTYDKIQSIRKTISNSSLSAIHIIVNRLRKNMNSSLFIKGFDQFTSIGENMKYLVMLKSGSEVITPVEIDFNMVSSSAIPFSELYDGYKNNTFNEKSYNNLSEFLMSRADVIDLACGSSPMDIDMPTYFSTNSSMKGGSNVILNGMIERIFDDKSGTTTEEEVEQQETVKMELKKVLESIMVKGYPILSAMNDNDKLNASVYSSILSAVSALFNNSTIINLQLILDGYENIKDDDEELEECEEIMYFLVYSLINMRKGKKIRFPKTAALHSKLNRTIRVENILNCFDKFMPNLEAKTSQELDFQKIKSCSEKLYQKIREQMQNSPIDSDSEISSLINEILDEMLEVYDELITNLNNNISSNLLASDGVIEGNADITESISSFISQFEEFLPLKDTSCLSNSLESSMQLFRIIPTIELAFKKLKNLKQYLNININQMYNICEDINVILRSKYSYVNLLAANSLKVNCEGVYILNSLLFEIFRNDDFIDFLSTYPIPNEAKFTEYFENSKGSYYFGINGIQIFPVELLMFKLTNQSIPGFDDSYSKFKQTIKSAFLDQVKTIDHMFFMLVASILEMASKNDFGLNSVKSLHYDNDKKVQTVKQINSPPSSNNEMLYVCNLSRVNSNITNFLFFFFEYMIFIRLFNIVLLKNYNDIDIAFYKLLKSFKWTSNPPQFTTQDVLLIIRLIVMFFVLRFSEDAAIPQRDSIGFYADPKKLVIRVETKIQDLTDSIKRLLVKIFSSGNLKEEQFNGISYNASNSTLEIMLNASEDKSTLFEVNTKWFEDIVSKNDLSGLFQEISQVDKSKVCNLFTTGGKYTSFETIFEHFMTYNSTHDYFEFLTSKQETLNVIRDPNYFYYLPTRAVAILSLLGHSIMPIASFNTVSAQSNGALCFGKIRF